MKKGYTVQHKRRREGKTNYRKRLTMLLSKKTRIVVRRTNTSMIAQAVKYNPKGDNIIVDAKKSHLKKLGWEYSGKNIPGAYLIGYLLGKKAQKAGIKEGILDLGLAISSKGSRIYATLKGIADSGLKIKLSKEILPSEERIKGAHIKAYLKNATKISEDFEKIKKEIDKL